ncbi:MAG: type II toxin-antitoxin system HigB family toxin, partial [Gammaproteobacteria bacterium]|nr:type II toxin-antitoxin system HigB family toxin [Gammaproteobacteria bacterium]
QAFGSADTEGDLVVFNIGGNKFRLIAFLHYGQQIAYIRHVFTHAEYDQWNKNR